MSNSENERKEERKVQQYSIGGELSDAELLQIAHDAGLIDLDDKYLVKPMSGETLETRKHNSTEQLPFKPVEDKSK